MESRNLESYQLTAKECGYELTPFSVSICFPIVTQYDSWNIERRKRNNCAIFLNEI